ncbi:guanylate kinase [Heliomicrobium modesticaldum Ice1]|uniref:Guanylate kinase n=1 Tax=Heliobacterium modesticaldum (strain ATCC 51547 / Ice1) TaxID=498761 RepID=B0TGS3_HELMI|nr:guanylate kinase [Heliomicrobium modesticaldum]ABZ84684.1 guanylate kinase [Heliomicrobium modesticaldum Ice1]
MGRGVLLVMSGPSGAGKGTLSRRLLNELPQLTLSISATTRKPREGEREGVHYYFLRKEDFERQIGENRFLEFAQVYDNYYGTPLAPVQAALASGKDVLLEIDIQGALQVKERYPEAALIFIAPPSLEELARRIYGRGTDSQEVIEKRLSLASQELEFINRYDYCVINDDVDRALTRLRAIVEAEKSRIYRKLE